MKTYILKKLVSYCVVAIACLYCVSVVIASCTDDGWKTCRTDGIVGIPIPTLCYYDVEEEVWVWGWAYMWTSGGQNPDCIDGSVGDGCDSADGVCIYTKYAFICEEQGPNPVPGQDPNVYNFSVGDCGGTG